jgi:cobalamin biosynthesis Mg chelatase CobN
MLEQLQDNGQVSHLASLFESATKRMDDNQLHAIQEKITQEVKKIGIDTVAEVLEELIGAWVRDEEVANDAERLLYASDLSLEYIPDLAEVKERVERAWEESVVEEYEGSVEALYFLVDLPMPMPEDLKKSIMNMIRGLVSLHLKFPEEARLSKDQVLDTIEAKLQKYKSSLTSLH